VTGEIVGATAAEQARRCLQNLQAVCEGAGASLARALRLTVYTTDLDEFAQVNEVYGSFFAGEDPPARVTVEVSALPKGALVEIDAIVAL
jgi:2-iminobutanoate/2-iminopropanoate deaminase